MLYRKLCLKLIAYLAIPLFLFSCSGYYIDDYRLTSDHVYFQGKKVSSSYTMESIVNGADRKSFEVLKYSTYAVDKDNAYYRDYRIDNADPKTFNAISYNHAKDKYRVWFKGSPIADADPASFEVIKGWWMAKKVWNWSKDSKRAYIKTRSVNVCDIESFKVLDLRSYWDGFRGLSYYSLPEDNWQIDKKCAYYNGNMLPSVDIETFHPLSNVYAKDKNKVYVRDSVEEGADPKSFKVNK